MKPWRARIAPVVCVATLAACEGLIGADFNRAAREEATQDDADAAHGDAASDATQDAPLADARTKDARADASAPLPECGDRSGLDVTAAWPMPGYCPTRPNRSAAPSLAAPKLRRRVPLAPTTGSSTFTWFASSVAVDGAGVAYGLVTELADSSLRNYVVAIDGTKELWRTDVSGSPAYVVAEVGAPVLAAGGPIYVAAGNALVALSRGGVVNWSKPLGTSVGAPLVLGDGTVVVTAGASVRAFLPNGDDAWTFAMDGSAAFFHGAVTATATGSLVVVQGPALGSTDARVISFNPGGTFNWTKPLASKPSTVPAVDDLGQIVVRSLTGLSVFTSTGSVASTKGAGGGNAGAIFPALLGSGAWFGDGFDLLFLDTSNGGTSTTTIGGRRGGLIATGDGDLVFAHVKTPDARVVSLAPDGAERWAVPIDLSSADLQAPALGADGSVYVPFADTLYVLGP